MTTTISDETDVLKPPEAPDYPVCISSNIDSIANGDLPKTLMILSQICNSTTDADSPYDCSVACAITAACGSSLYRPQLGCVIVATQR